jgi:glycosyltransferase involved in cell wall biosynthesis
MPSLNSQRYVGAAVASLLAQRGPQFELVVQDGGSSDGTVDVIAAFRDERVSIVSEPDSGQSEALNRGVRRARGDWIAWLNADDLIEPAAFGAVEALLEDPTVDLIYGDHVTVDRHGSVLKRYSSAPLSRRRLLARGCYIFTGTTYFRRDLFDRLGYFDERLSFSMDYEYFLRLADEVNARYCPQVLASFRLQPDSKTMQGWGQFRENLQVRARYGGFGPDLIGATAFGQAYMGAYLLSRRLWLSETWRRLRPAKKL